MDISDKTDYHLHTYYSDGKYSPEEVVEWAHGNGLTDIAITDHDGIGGIAEARKAAERYGINVLPGIEFSTVTSGGIGVHMLGYGIDPENRNLIATCDEILEKRQTRNERLMQALKSDGYDITMADVVTRPGQTFVGKPVIARALMRKGYIRDVKEAFDNIFSGEKYRAIKKNKISTEEAMAVIQEAGGVPVYAHPALTRGIGERGTEEFYENAEAVVQRMLGHGLWGIECYYPKFTEEETERFVKMTERYDLTATKGSDYHGD
ncbi:MAG: PHP domain-containing protein [Eubacteriaceae bacterium]|jgi:predicted metal-dependent phosphoesterase TrpH|nr:PHP domain-containing protein [Eubacteriaceae bacterium]